MPSNAFTIDDDDDDGDDDGGGDGDGGGGVWNQVTHFSLINEH